MARGRVVLAACIALAALSLTLPWDLNVDPFGWLLWGREITDRHLALDTVDYPSWKPLPVAFTIVFSLFGGAAPALWLVVARTGSLVAIALAYRLGARLGGRVAGLIATLGVATLSGGLRYFASGASEPLLVALVLFAIDRHLGGRRGQALGLVFAASLLRPEVWPFLLIYAAWYGRRGLRPALAAAALLGLIPLLWFVPEWIGAGDPLHGSVLAKTSTEARHTHDLAHPTLEAVRRGAALVLAPLTLAAVLAVVQAARRRQRLPLALAAGAIGWMALVATMTALGYPGLPRFALPAAAVVCVLAGVGVARVLDRVPPGRLRGLAVCALVLVAAPFAASRGHELAKGVKGAGAQDRVEDQLGAVIRRLGGPARVMGCPPVAVDGPFRTALAWRLGVPATLLTETGRATLVFRSRRRAFTSYGGRIHLRDLRAVAPARRVARSGAWDVLGSVAPRRRLPTPCSRG